MIKFNLEKALNGAKVIINNTKKWVLAVSTMPSISVCFEIDLSQFPVGYGLEGE